MIRPQYTSRSLQCNSHPLAPNLLEASSNTMHLLLKGEFNNSQCSTLHKMSLEEEVVLKSISNTKNKKETILDTTLI